MKIKEIEVTVDHRINLGDFEGSSSPVRIKGVLEDGDDVEDCTKVLYKSAEILWARQMLDTIKLYRRIRESSKDKGIYKLTGELFDNAVMPAMTELKRILSES